MSFPRYPRYRDSGVEWLGEVPEHWEVLPGRRLFEQRRDPSRTYDEQLSATQKYGVIPQRLFMRMEDQKVVLALGGTDSFKQVQENDFVISLRSFQGGIEHSAYSGCVSPAYTVLRPTSTVSPRYWAYTLKSVGYISALQSVTDGIREGKSVSYQQFGSLELPICSLSEQAAIAAFLDRETAKIDALAAEQQHLISLLKEKRQAVISHAVTRGLDPDAPMKPSGVEWLGDVPAHWNVIPIKYLVGFRSGGTPDKSRLEYWNGSVPWASAKDLKKDSISDTEDHITEHAVERGAATLIPANCVLVVVRGMILARTFPVVQAGVPLAINQDLKALIPRSGLDPSFLADVLRGTSRETLRRLDEAGHGTKALRMEAWTSMPLPVPPLHEQRMINGELNRLLNEVDHLVLQSERAISLFQERRTALISAAVTGKIDVRNLGEAA